MNAVILIAVALCVVLAVVQAGHVLKEKNIFHMRPDYVQADRADVSQMHEVLFAVKQKNLDAAHDLLMQLADPTNEKYGKWLTRAEVGALTSNTDATSAIEQYLAQNGIEIVKKTLYGEYITAKAPIGTWEKVFATTFYNFKSSTSKKAPVVARSHEYSLDTVIADHVEAVFYTCQLPSLLHSRVPPTESRLNGKIVPADLNAYYNITFNNGNGYGSQSVFETIGQDFSPADLAQFEATYGIPSQKVDNDIGGYDSDNTCKVNANNCAEANLDVQYMIALAQNVPMTYYYDAAADSFLDWITAIANEANPILINSVSYGSTESALPTTLTNQFNTEAMKAGLEGVSVFVSSGDDGAAGSNARNSAANCGYSPSFPATSQYVTAVGATQGPENNAQEVVCSSKTGGVITSGGGFSTKFTAPSWQTAAIALYMSTVSTKPVTGYVTNGRGYPDLSLAGYNYQVIIGGKTYSLSGTSASSPSLAALVALINSRRLAAGKPALGFLNPSIYQLYSRFVNDVTTGNNLCTVSVCCSQGFYAAPGWDPATGFGSVNFGKFFDVFYAL